MARTPDRDKFLTKIPEEFHKLLKKDEDFDFTIKLWKLEDDQIKTLMPSIPEKLKPIFDQRINKPAGKRGNRSNLPYDTDDIKLATALMKQSPGANILTDDGVEGTLLTVQVLAKLQVGEAVKTVSITGIQEIK
jgi:hypothetical protein